MRGNRQPIMNRYLKRITREARRYLGRLAQWRRWHIARRYKVEEALLRGRSPATGTHPSIIHFSVNKVATQFTKRILIHCARQNGLLPVRMSEYAWHTDFPYLFTLSAEEVKPYLHIFRPQGYLYTVFGGLVEGIPNVADYRVVIILRDPRDVLVSGYFSYAFSHITPEGDENRQTFAAFRDHARSLGVDGYVKESCGNTQRRYQQYLDFAAAYPHAYLTTYEAMVTDFPTWLDNLLTYCGLEISESLWQQLLKEGMTGRPQVEDISKHRRQAKPGDHLRKLQPETITYLNNELAPILTHLGYTS